MKVALSIAALAGSALLADCEAITPKKVEDDVVTNELQRNLWHLNKIGRDNGGNRAFGLPGYKASVDFVLERAQKRFSKQMNTWVMPFNATFEQTRSIKVTGPAKEDVFVITVLYNPATPVPGGITGQLINTPVDDTRGSACFEDQWTGIDATGKIALIKRGVCPVSDKLKLARAHGATAVILYNQTPGTTYSTLTLGIENVGQLVPMGIIPLEVGSAWVSRVAAGEVLTVNLLVDSIFDTRETWNVFSETKEGDPNSVIMIGAHLDSVQAGPGVNDDGSGTTALMEIMGSVKKFKGFPHKIRFAWWGAEESGLVGSLRYTEGLSEEEADKIKYYFNYDMIGSPFPTYTVYRSPNSGPGPAKLYEYLKAAGKPVEYGEFATNSDYLGFLNRGIPSSGLFTGAGAPTDPNYHTAGDDIDNINWDALTVNAKAAGNVLAQFALSLEGVPPREKSTPLLRGREAMSYQFKKWKAAYEEAEHGHSCAHKAGTMVV